LKPPLFVLSDLHIAAPGDFVVRGGHCVVLPGNHDPELYHPEAGPLLRSAKEQIKHQVDKVGDEHLGVLYRIILALEEPTKGPPRPELDGAVSWSQFISEMYGSTADAPLERWPEGVFEERLALE